MGSGGGWSSSHREPVGVLRLSLEPMDDVAGVVGVVGVRVRERGRVE